MKLTKWEPFNELDNFFDDRLFQPFALFPKPGLDFAVDVYEEKGNVIAKMNLPGINLEALDIALEDDMLTISGRREEEKEMDEKNYYSKEIRRGSFSRSVRLPKSVDAAKTEATYKNGELLITMPIVAGIKDTVVKVAIKSK